MPRSRRELLASGALALAGCAVRKDLPHPSPVQPRLARVLVSKDRVIRMIAGLRPYRPSGFVVRAEKLGEKVVVHNYGHGGCGITLSWGTAQLAAEEAAKSGLRACAVLGSGVVGLSTARLLQERGFQPVIYAKATPPDTTSNVAGGAWGPTTLYDRAKLTPEFSRQFVTAARIAHRRFQSYAGDEYGVRWLPFYFLSNRQPFAPPTESPESEIERLHPGTRRLEPNEHPFPARYAMVRYAMLIEPAIYLNALTRDYLLNGGRIVIREFRSASELAALSEPLLFNCTGLGSRELFNDLELTPVRGQLTFLLPQPEVQYMTAGPDDIYMFPRRDGILLGGSHDVGEWSTEPDPATGDRILRENGALFGDMRV